MRHLRAFLVLAEELNFTRAAERLHLAQQALSAQVKQFEERLGTPLFVRSTRSVGLTAAGEALLERLPGALAELDDAVAAARRAAEGEIGRLTVGLLATGPLDLTPRVLREFSRARPGAAVSLRNIDFSDPTGGVRSGETDVAIVWLPFDPAGLEVEVLLEDSRDAVLPAGHPLAAAEEVGAAALAAEPFGWIEGMDPAALDFWTLAEHRDGPARIGAHISGFDDYFTAIRSGQAVAASPSMLTAAMPWPDLELRPIPDAAPALLATCRRTEDPNPLPAVFARIAVEVAAEIG